MRIAVHFKGMDKPELFSVSPSHETLVKEFLSNARADKQQLCFRDNMNMPVRIEVSYVMYARQYQ